MSGGQDDRAPQSIQEQQYFGGGGIGTLMEALATLSFRVSHTLVLILAAMVVSSITSGSHASGEAMDFSPDSFDGVISTEVSLLGFHCFWSVFRVCFFWLSIEFVRFLVFF